MLTDALPNGTVSGDVGDVERSSDHLVMMRLPAGVSKCTRASQIRHPGQDGGPARPAECRTRQGAHAVRTVSVAKAAVAHGRLEERTSVAVSRLRRWPGPTHRLGGKMRPFDRCSADLWPADDWDGRGRSVCGCHRRRNAHGRAHPIVESRACARGPMGGSGGGLYGGAK